MAFVMNKKTGKAYVTTTDTVQTRDRLQLEGTGIRNPEHTQIAQSSLVNLSTTDAVICFQAEKLIRGKHKHTESDNTILMLHSILKDEVCNNSNIFNALVSAKESA